MPRLERFVDAAEHWQYLVTNLPSPLAEQQETAREQLQLCRKHVGSVTLQGRLSFSLEVAMPVPAPAVPGQPQPREPALAAASAALADAATHRRVRTPVLIAGAGSALVAAAVGSYFAVLKTVKTEAQLQVNGIIDTSGATRFDAILARQTVPKATITLLDSGIAQLRRKGDHPLINLEGRGQPARVPLSQTFPLNADVPSFFKSRA